MNLFNHDPEFINKRRKANEQILNLLLEVSNSSDLRFGQLIKSFKLDEVDFNEEPEVTLEKLKIILNT